MKDLKTLLTETVQVLREGGVILYPTDTVWGLGCDATNPTAVARIYEIKKRADSKALVLLADSLDMVARYVREIPDAAIQLVEVNDAPMTVIYPGAYVGNKPEDGRHPGADDGLLPGPGLQTGPAAGVDLGQYLRRTHAPAVPGDSAGYRGGRRLRCGAASGAGINRFGQPNHQGRPTGRN